MDYVFLAGTTGLGPSLSSDEKVQMLDGLREFAPKLLLQVGSLDLEESVKLAEHAKNSNIHAMVSYPPYFYPRMVDEWVVKGLRRAVQSAPGNRVQLSPRDRL